MSNYLIITLGSRDIQLNLNNIESSDFILKKEDKNTFIEGESFKLSAYKLDNSEYNYGITPRDGGEVLLNNFSIFEKYIDLSLIKPVLNYIKEEGIKIDILMLIFTDQTEDFENEKIEKRFYRNDTVYFADIIEKIVSKDLYFSNTTIDLFGVYTQLTDLGEQYNYFSKIHEELYASNEVNHVYLFPQGGIDSINQALTLRLIEIFKDKLTQIQKPENNTLQLLDFPSKFLTTLNKEKIEKSISVYDFNALVDLDGINDTIRELAKFAASRMNLDYNINDLDSTLIGNFKFFKYPTKDFEKLKDLYLSAKSFYAQRRYNEYVWKLFSIHEVLFKLPLQNILNEKKHSIFRDVKSEKWDDFWRKRFPELKDFQISKKKGDSYVYRSTCQKLNEIGELKKHLNANFEEMLSISKKLEVLASYRNEIAHDLGSVNIDKLDATLSEKFQDYSSSKLNDDFDKLFKMEDFDYLEEVKIAIQNLL